MTKNEAVTPAPTFTDREGEVFTAKLDAGYGDAELIDLAVQAKDDERYTIAFFKEDAESIINLIREAAK